MSIYKSCRRFKMRYSTNVILLQGTCDIKRSVTITTIFELHVSKTRCYLMITFERVPNNTTNKIQIQFRIFFPA